MLLAECPRLLHAAMPAPSSCSVSFAEENDATQVEYSGGRDGEYSGFSKTSTGWEGPLGYLDGAKNGREYYSGAAGLRIFGYWMGDFRTMFLANFREIHCEHHRHEGGMAEWRDDEGLRQLVLRQ